MSEVSTDVIDTVINTVLNSAKDLPLVSVAIIIIVGGFRRWWVWGYQLIEAQDAVEAMKAERDEWKELAFTASRSTKSAGDTASKLADALRANPS